MKLKYTILYVKDVSKSLDFYQRAFNFKTKMLHQSGDYGELDSGNTTLSFSSLKLMTELGKSPKQARKDAPTFEIAFETTDVKQALDRAISAGAKLIQEVREEPWGQTTSYVSDIDDFLIEICSPIENQA
ncbi:MAG: VOC family protein [Arenicella sp.]|nr:VOC family protein [Arenicella sp.]